MFHVYLSVAISEVVCVHVAEDWFSSSAMPSIFQPGNELIRLVNFLRSTNYINLISMIFVGPE